MSTFWRTWFWLACTLTWCFRPWKPTFLSLSMSLWSGFSASPQTSCDRFGVNPPQKCVAYAGLFRWRSWGFESMSGNCGMPLMVFPWCCTLLVLGFAWPTQRPNSIKLMQIFSSVLMPSSCTFGSRAFMRFTLLWAPRYGFQLCNDERYPIFATISVGYDLPHGFGPGVFLCHHHCVSSWIWRCHQRPVESRCPARFLFHFVNRLSVIFFSFLFFFFFFKKKKKIFF